MKIAELEKEIKKALTKWSVLTKKLELQKNKEKLIGFKCKNDKRI